MPEREIPIRNRSLEDQIADLQLEQTFQQMRIATLQQVVTNLVDALPASPQTAEARRILERLGPVSPL